ncbi:MAG: transketolase C-terminal domain-containing protein [Candidatus Helarchaeota archaeon]
MDDDLIYDLCEQEFIWMGNEAMAEGCLAGGCRFFAGYPITPQNEVPEHLSKRMPQLGGKFIQMEDEIGSIGAVLGASAVGTKAMTSTSGPGFSLMQEIVSWAATIEVPMVIAEVQRTGPGSGCVSLPHHSDVMQFHYGGNGEYILPTIAPTSCQELFDFAIDAFNIAEKYRCPTILMSDAWLGHIHELVKTPSADEIKKKIIWNRETETAPPNLLAFSSRNRKDNSIRIPPAPVLGTPYFPFWVPSVTHVPGSGMAIEGDTMSDDHKKSFAMVDVINNKIIENEAELASSRVKTQFLDDADYAVVCYGMPYRSAMRAVKDARKEGMKVGIVKMEVIWPFPKTAIAKICEGVKELLIPEINLGQMFIELEREALRQNRKVHLVTQISYLHEPVQIYSKMKEVWS